MRITIGGPPGSGTTTVASILSRMIGYKLISAGEMFRKMASERGMSLEEFGRLAEENEIYDLEVDRRQKEEAERVDDAIVEGRLSGHMITNADLKVWINAPIDVRARRVAGRDGMSVEEARRRIVEREACERRRYAKYYGINLEDLSIYHLVIDSSKWSAEEIASIIMSAVKR